MAIQIWNGCDGKKSGVVYSRRNLYYGKLKVFKLSENFYNLSRVFFSEHFPDDIDKKQLKSRLSVHGRRFILKTN